MLRISELKKLNNLLWDINTKLTNNVQNYIDIAYQVKNVNLKIEYKDFQLTESEKEKILGSFKI